MPEWAVAAIVIGIVVYMVGGYIAAGWAIMSIRKLKKKQKERDGYRR
jgi:CBS domain containing-hemolysin-like protein